MQGECPFMCTNISEYVETLSTTEMEDDTS